MQKGNEKKTGHPGWRRAGRIAGTLAGMQLGACVGNAISRRTFLKGMPHAEGFGKIRTSFQPEKAITQGEWLMNNPKHLAGSLAMSGAGQVAGGVGGYNIAKKVLPKAAKDKKGNPVYNSNGVPVMYASIVRPEDAGPGFRKRGFQNREKLAHHKMQSMSPLPVSEAKGVSHSPAFMKRMRDMFMNAKSRFHFNDNGIPVMYGIVDAIKPIASKVGGYFAGKGLGLGISDKLIGKFGDKIAPNMNIRTARSILRIGGAAAGVGAAGVATNKVFGGRQDNASTQVPEQYRIFGNLLRKCRGNNSSRLVKDTIHAAKKARLYSNRNDNIPVFYKLEDMIKSDDTGNRVFSISNYVNRGR